MFVWEFRPANVNDYAPFVSTNYRDLDSGMFDAEGLPLTWKKKPKVEVFIEPGKKKPKPVADISVLAPGALVLSDAAKTALAPFLLRFGQLLEMECQGEARWFYNVTNLVSCIDESRSTRRPSGDISKEEFFEDRVPVVESVFKDPVTAVGKLYVNALAKSALEEIIAAAGLVGAEFAEPGPPPKKPRPGARAGGAPLG